MKKSCPMRRKLNAVAGSPSVQHILCCCKSNKPNNTLIQIHHRISVLTFSSGFIPFQNSRHGRQIFTADTLVFEFLKTIFNTETESPLTSLCPHPQRPHKTPLRQSRILLSSDSLLFLSALPISLPAHRRPPVSYSPQHHSPGLWFSLHNTLAPPLRMRAQVIGQLPAELLHGPK